MIKANECWEEGVVESGQLSYTLTAVLWELSWRMVCEFEVGLEECDCSLNVALMNLSPMLEKQHPEKTCISHGIWVQVGREVISTPSVPLDNSTECGFFVLLIKKCMTGREMCCCENTDPRRGSLNKGRDITLFDGDEISSLSIFADFFTLW